MGYAFQKMEDLPTGYSVSPERTKPLGTGHALYCVRNIVKDNFAVINADDFYGRDAFVQLANHLKRAKAGEKIAHHCMVGYALGNTLTENGTVSRGHCVLDSDGMLQGVTERTKIMKKEGCAAYENEDGKWIDLPFDATVSMNCWGFTPDIFDYLETDFRRFLDNIGENPLKAEFYLPFAVDTQRKLGLCDVKVYKTTAVWIGVTYAEDKANVKSSIRKLIADGEYPEKLWN